MPYRDLEKRRAAVRRSKAKAGKPLVETPPQETPKGNPVKLGLPDRQRMDGGELRPVRCDHCGDWHATVQETRECTDLTPLGEWCANYSKSAWARRPDKRALVDVRAIASSLAKGKVADHVRFGIEGPTFAEIATVLDA